ncbi:MAG: S8 family serine peptidase [Planctomycetes bacterium]|nr:S8 family serine peptidase [Planctomycetota bacterium]
MRSRILSLALVMMLTAGLVAAQDESWTQLSLSTCAVDEFLAARPASDGRGVVIAILDTGVDPSIPGLTHTPDGAVKVIDVQDFTGEGDIELHWMRMDVETGKLVEHDDDGTPIHYTPPQLPADEAGAQRRWWFGTFDESLFVNSDVSDLNDSGTTDDQFPVLVTALEGDTDDLAVCYLDTNMDRSFADEKPLQNYKLKYDTFTLHRKEPENQIVPLTFAVNIFLRESKIVIHFDDGAHGTHVAGIAAGYRINNQDGFNGVAPGAKLMSLKIGQNAIGGPSVTESIKRALEYAGRYAREHNVPVVCNLSFGVESEVDGWSAIDKWVDEFMPKNPYVVFCTSAGNEGPGLSSVGTPAGAYHAISVAALLAADSARDVQGFDLKHAIPTTFSSRGGELAKPDVATPGLATSTVPRWVTRGDHWGGTSMASPYAAGLCAVLISDAMQRYPGEQIRAWDVRRALSLSGRAISGHTPLDYGWGVPNLPKAADILNKLVPAAKHDPILGYKITIASPHTPSGTGRAAYWRGTWFPADERQTFEIAPVFAPNVDAAARTGFTRKFELRANADWIRLPQQATYLRSEQSASVYVEYDAAKLKQPGVYVGTVDALAEGLVAFRLLNTIVVPQRFTAAEDFTLKFKDQTAHGWTPQRYFLAVPPGASAMKLTLAAPEGKESKARFEYVFDPAGHGHRVRGNVLDTDTDRREIVREFTDELYPGVWEAVILSDRPDREWPYELTAQFFGLHADQPLVTDWSGGDQPSGELTVTNIFEKRVVAELDGQLEGYRQHKEAKFKGLKDTLTYSIKLDERFDRARIELQLTPEAYAETTDIGVQVKDGEGEAIYTGAFSNRKLTTTVRGSGTLELVITGGFAIADDKRETPIDVKIDKLLASPIPIKVSRDGSTTVNFVPGVPITVDFKCQKRLKDPPKGLRPVGYLRFRARTSHDTALRVPLDIGG